LKKCRNRYNEERNKEGLNFSRLRVFKKLRERKEGGVHRLKRRELPRWKEKEVFFSA